MEVIEVEKKNIAKVQERKKGESEALAGKLGQLSVTISKQAGENDKLFGTVTSMEIAGALEKEGHEIDKRKIMLEEKPEDCIKKTVKINDENFYLTVGNNFAHVTVPRENDPFMSDTRMIAETLCSEITKTMEMRLVLQNISTHTNTPKI